ncbi:Elongator protein 3/MiaB/NifB [Macleaya cordata]|uniref:Radical S-adenosyl methionine domain-containing protein 1, mitochondrial n=1 Tax=Macleaya cordata TaxID=56857 RepID=A0A200R4F8_MACCD|nr:Elongator protein 3/MiaB/NifB [Macleaya cordata]
MLKSAFAPILSTIPSKPKFPVLSISACKAFTQKTPLTPTVRENASTNTINTFQPSLSSPTSAYVHLPFCRKRCHYCDFPIVALGSSSNQTYDDDPRITNYVQLLCREIEATTISKSNNDPPLKTVFFGGGTPSLVPPKLVFKILETLNSKFGVNSDAEISIEMDPGTFDAKKMSELLELGVNRVSLGVQAFQEELLKACGRAHSVKEVYEAIEIIGSCGVNNWSLDLISSLPHQTSEMWKESLESAIKARPTHVSVYDLQVEKDTKFGLLYKPGEFPLPNETQSAELYKMASKTLSNAGYNHYEISSYSKEGYECKHNLTYWKNGFFYAFGLGSASHIGGVRFSRPRKMKEYTGYVQNLEDGVLNHHENGEGDAKDLEMDVVMLSLRTARGLDLKSFREAFGSSLVFSLCKTFRPYIESGHVLLLDENRRALTAEEFSSVLSSESDIEETVAFIRLSDPDGFLLSNDSAESVSRLISVKKFVKKLARPIHWCSFIGGVLTRVSLMREKSRMRRTYQAV